jgi:hypothetical protein
MINESLSKREQMEKREKNNELRRNQLEGRESGEERGRNGGEYQERGARRREMKPIIRRKSIKHLTKDRIEGDKEMKV